MKRILTVVLVVGAIVAAACNQREGADRALGLLAAADTSGDSTPRPRPGPVASVTVLPSLDTVSVGDSAGFFADLRDADGNAISDSHVRWTVADPTVARIEAVFGQSVILRALRLGTTTVTARNHGKTGSAQLVVDSLRGGGGDTVATVTVTPSADTVAVGDTATFFAELRDAQGNPLSGRTVSWTVSDSSVARIEGAFGQTVVIRAVGSGASLVTATSEGKSGSGSVVVR